MGKWSDAKIVFRECITQGTQGSEQKVSLAHIVWSFLNRILTHIMGSCASTMETESLNVVVLSTGDHSVPPSSTSCGETSDSLHGEDGSRGCEQQDDETLQTPCANTAALPRNEGRRVTFVAGEDEVPCAAGVRPATRRRSMAELSPAELDAIAEALARGASFGPFVLSVAGSTVSSVAEPRGADVAVRGSRQRLLSIASTSSVEEDDDLHSG